MIIVIIMLMTMMMIIAIENREVHHLVPESILLLTNNWEGIYKIFNCQLTNTFAWSLVKLGITN